MAQPRSGTKKPPKKKSSQARGNNGGGRKPKLPAAKKPGPKTPKSSPVSKAAQHSVVRPAVIGSAFPWAVTEEIVKQFGDSKLRDVMCQLLTAEAYRVGADITKVIVNAEPDASDDGEDASTPAGRAKDTWFSDVPTCWQLKAGNAGQAAKLRNEVTKKRPAAILRAGGRFVVIASGVVDGGKGISARLQVLCDQARRARLPSDRLDVYSSELLTTWINEHPAIAASLRGFPPGFMSLSEWEQLPSHRDPWVASAALEAKLNDARQALSFDDPRPAVHLHIFGPPGVGKTRFALELCKSASWVKAVLYVPQCANADVIGMLAAASRAGTGQLVLVVDEALADQIKSLASSAFVASDRLRVISIGPRESPDRELIRQLEVPALDDETMAKVIEAAQPSMPRDHTRYVVRFADGYTRLARMAAMTIASNPDVHTAGLLSSGEIRQLMDKMLIGGNRQHLHVLALLSSVGWSGVREEEGKSIAAHLGLNWSEVQASVQWFDREYGIAPRANDLRYISPAPLGVYLALDAFQTYPDKVRSLPEKLPNDEARRAYNERLQSILANPRARTFGEEELARFFDWSHFLDANAVDRWVTLSSANPAMAADRVREAMQGATDDQRRQIQGSARRELVEGLTQLAVHTASFHDAMLALAELAAAENETWANNASAEFVVRFQIVLGGTARPYLERLVVIDELVASERPVLHALALRALAKAGAGHESLDIGSAPSIGPGQPAWHPKTGQERLECALAAFTRLEKLAARDLPEGALIETIEHLSRLLRDALVREPIATFMRTAVAHHPTIREPVRHEVARIAQYSRELWRDSDEETILWIESLADEFSDKSLSGRLREAAGHYVDPDKAHEKLSPLAMELLANDAVLWSEWPWLTSGEAVGAWELGEELERLDAEGTLLSTMLHAPNTGPEVRVIAGYMRSRATRMPSGWLDDKLDGLENQPDVRYPVLFELTQRLADTSRGAQRITRMVRADRCPPNAIGALAFGGWVMGPDVLSLRDLFALLIENQENDSYVLNMMDTRLQKHPEDRDALGEIAIRVVSQPRLLEGGTMTLFHWNRLARALLPEHVREVVRTIFAAQCRKGRGRFFLELSETMETFDACIDVSPLGVWEELAPYLAGDDAGRFVIGFPSHVMALMPRAPVLEWIAEEPSTRVYLIAKIVAKDFSDESLAASLLDRWGKDNNVRQTFFSAFVTGGWNGDASDHWDSLAQELESLATRSKIGGVRRWAQEAAIELRRMAEHDRGREAEEKVRGWR